MNQISIFRPKRYCRYSRADKQFYRMITSISSREFLQAMLQTFNVVSLAYQVDSSEGLILHPNDTLKDHEMIIDAICNRDPEQAEFLMRDHFKKAIVVLKTKA